MLEEPDQRTVIHGLQNGSREAWSALYDGYSTDLWRYVARLIGPETTSVADIVQETFLTAARSARQFDSERGTLWAWLTGIAHHQTSLFWRQIGKSARLKELFEAHGGELRRWLDNSDPGDAWERQELADIVRSVLAEIPVDYAALLTAKYLDEQSLEELSQSMGGSVEAIKSRLARARREFRTRFELMTQECNPRPRQAFVLPNPISQAERQ